MDSNRGAKVAGWAGIVFLVLSCVVVVVSPSWPSLGATQGEVVAYYRAHRLPFLVGNYLAIAALIPGFVQLGFLVGVFRRAEGEGGWLWIVVLGSGVAAYALGGAVLVVYQVIPFELEAGQEAVAKGFSDLGGAGLALFLLAQLGYVLAVTWASVATRALPRWHAALGVGVAILSLTGSLGAIVTPPLLAGGGPGSCVPAGAFFVWNTVIAVIFLLPVRPAAVGAVS